MTRTEDGALADGTPRRALRAIKLVRSRTAAESFYMWIGSLSLIVGGVVGMTLCTEAPFLFYRRKFPASSAELKPSQTREPQPSDPIAKLPEGLIEPLTSITERTTERLFEKASQQ